MMAKSPMALIRKLDAAVAASGQRAQEMRKAAAQATAGRLRNKIN
jgi:hypothetical protein